jgi:hypothetical protein
VRISRRSLPGDREREWVKSRPGSNSASDQHLPGRKRSTGWVRPQGSPWRSGMPPLGGGQPAGVELDANGGRSVRWGAGRQACGAAGGGERSAPATPARGRGGLRSPTRTPPKGLLPRSSGVAQEVGVRGERATRRCVDSPSMRFVAVDRPRYPSGGARASRQSAGSGTAPASAPSVEMHERGADDGTPFAAGAERSPGDAGAMSGSYAALKWSQVRQIGFRARLIQAARPWPGRK